MRPKVAILLSLRLHLGRSALQWDCKTKHFLQKERAKVGSFAALAFCRISWVCQSQCKAKCGSFLKELQAAVGKLWLEFEH